LSEGGVFIDGLSGFDLYESLAKKPLWKLIISNRGSLEAWKNPGGLGGELCISTKEFEYVLNKEFYKNPHCIK
jgi:hypothetical protein